MTVLTHGAKNGNLASNECFYNIEELWELFIADKCPSPAGKPKIFIIQVSEFIFVIFYNVAL